MIYQSFSCQRIPLILLKNHFMENLVNNIWKQYESQKVAVSHILSFNNILDMIL